VLRTKCNRLRDRALANTIGPILDVQSTDLKRYLRMVDVVAILYNDVHSYSRRLLWVGSGRDQRRLYDTYAAEPVAVSAGRSIRGGVHMSLLPGPRICKRQAHNDSHGIKLDAHVSYASVP